jgi:hypothetical protein
MVVNFEDLNFFLHMLHCRIGLIHWTRNKIKVLASVPSMIFTSAMASSSSLKIPTCVFHNMTDVYTVQLPSTFGMFGTKTNVAVAIQVKNVER